MKIRLEDCALINGLAGVLPIQVLPPKPTDVKARSTCSPPTQSDLLGIDKRKVFVVKLRIVGLDGLDQCVIENLCRERSAPPLIGRYSSLRHTVYPAVVKCNPSLR